MMNSCEKVHGGCHGRSLRTSGDVYAHSVRVCRRVVGEKTARELDVRSVVER
jgi:hypothetical protein